MDFDSKTLKKDLVTKRVIEDELSMDEAAKQIGISKATLSRLERGNLPDVVTLGLVMTWLKTTPNKYFTN